MTTGNAEKDLLVLVADRDAELALRELLKRPQALGIYSISFDFYRHPNRDSGCFSSAHEFLRAFAGQYRYTLIIFDKAGSGQENHPAAEIECELKQRLSRNGWDNKAEVIVIEPELEIWIWSDSPNVDVALGWAGRTPRLHDWLTSKGLISTENPKPADPKRVFELALREARKPKSASIFAELAGNVSFNRCTDPSFAKLKTTLQQWFGAANFSGSL